MNINNLIATVNKLGGLNSGNKYTVQITPPSTIKVDARSLMFLCDSISLPGSHFTLEQIRHKGYGLAEQRVAGIQFDDIQCTFFVDNSNVALGFFQKWMQLIMSTDPNHQTKKVNGVAAETVNYPDEYWGEMEITLLDKQSQNVIKYQVTKLFPTSIGALQLGWDQNDQVVRLQVTFSYRSFSTSITENVATEDNTFSSNQQINPDFITIN